MPTAEPLDPATVRIDLPQQYDGNIVDLLTDIEQLIVEPDLAARIVIDENSGIIVMGQDVKVSMVAVAQGNLTVTIAESPQVSQPLPFANGQTAVVPRSDVTVDEEGSKLAIVPQTVTLKQLVDGLNALGIGPARHDPRSCRPSRPQVPSRPISRCCDGRACFTDILSTKPAGHAARRRPDQQDAGSRGRRRVLRPFS